MANFYIGQRVRIIASWATELVGMETYIQAEVLMEGKPAWETGIAHPSGGFWSCWKHEAGNLLAPIIPPHEAGQWSVIEALMPSLRDMRELA